MARTDKNLQRTEESGPLSTEGIEGIGVATPEVRAAALAEGKLLRRIRTLVEGEFIRGRLVGPGAPIDAKSPDGEMAPVNTWDLDMGNDILVGILSCHQLDSDLPRLVGRKVYIEKGAAKSVGARRVNQYAVVDLEARTLGDAVPVAALAAPSAPHNGAAA